MTTANLARSTARVVVVGGSLAGHRAAAALRSLGYDGSLTVLGAEPHPPYDRFPLSKAYLAGRMGRRRLDLPDLACDPLPDVEWLLGVEATGLDLDTGSVRLADGETIAFDGLVVATGAEASGREQAERVEGVFTLRTVDDAQALRRALKRRLGMRGRRGRRPDRGRGGRDRRRARPCRDARRPR